MSFHHLLEFKYEIIILEDRQLTRSNEQANKTQPDVMNLVMDDFNHDLAYFPFIFSKHTLAIDSTHLIKILLDRLHEKGDVRPGGKCTANERRNYHVETHNVRKFYMQKKKLSSSSAADNEHF